MDLNATRWLIIRISICAFWAVGAWVHTGDWPGFSRAVSWLNLLLAFVLPCAFFLVQLSIVFSRSTRRSAWRPISWITSPFKMDDPVQVLHLGAFCFMAFGFTGCVKIVLQDGYVIPLPAIVLAFGFGTWSGLRLLGYLMTRKGRMFSPGNH